MSEFQVSKSNYVDCRIVANDLSNQTLAEGEVLVKVDKFALTANNITYAVVAEKLSLIHTSEPTRPYKTSYAVYC
mgnify:CR=1 FL=1